MCAPHKKLHVTRMSRLCVSLGNVWAQEKCIGINTAEVHINKRCAHLGKVSEWWNLARRATSPVHARPVYALTCRFDSRGCPVHRHPRPRAEEAGRTSSTRLLQLAGVERLPRAKDEIWYQG